MMHTPGPPGRCMHGHRGPMALDGTGCATCLGESCRRLFEALEMLFNFPGNEEAYEMADALLKELRPHVAKEES